MNLKGTGLFLLMLAFLSTHGRASAADDLALTLRGDLSQETIVQGAPLELTITDENETGSPQRVLPLNHLPHVLREGFNLVFDEPPAGDEGRTTMPIGIDPAIGGLNAVVPLDLAAGGSMSGTADLSRCIVYTNDAKGRMLFSIPGRYRFRVQYRILEEAPEDWALASCDIFSAILEVVVAPAPTPEPNGLRPEWPPVIGYFTNIDGERQLRPDSGERVPDARRKEIQFIFRELQEHDRTARSDAAATVRFMLSVADDGTLYFSPFTTPGEHRAFTASPVRMQLLRTRMLTLQSTLAERGIVAYPEGRWSHRHGQCGSGPRYPVAR